MKKLLFNAKPIHKDAGILVLRLFAGLTMLFSHGWGKMLKIANGEWKFADVMGLGEEASLILAVFAEVVCSALIVLGLSTRLATIPLIITMIVAVFLIHADDGFGKQELGLFYLMSFITILLTGPGKFSLDKLISKS